MISVLIATKERPDSLLVCLQSIVSNQFAQFELIVIDQSNVVSALIKQYLKKHHRIHFYHLPNRGRERGKSYALQQGLMKAKGEIIAFTDDDCIVDKKWLKILWQGFAQNKCDGLFGQVLPWLLESKLLMRLVHQKPGSVPDQLVRMRKMRSLPYGHYLPKKLF